MSDEDTIEILKTQWADEQRALKTQLIKEDSLGIPISNLTHVAGVDISFVEDGQHLPDHPEANALAAIVILSWPELKVLSKSFKATKLTVPYIPNFLAFREVPVLMELWNEIQSDDSIPKPQLIFVDGNGIMHKRGCGAASHFGIVAGIPTIGVAKTPFLSDGITRESIKALCASQLKSRGDWFPIKGKSGELYGAALRSSAGESSGNPVYVSIGHRISLETAISLTRAACLYRVPEPIRQADLLSRSIIRKAVKANETPQTPQTPQATTTTTTTATTTTTTTDTLGDDTAR